MKKKSDLVLILPNIRSVYNVGSIFRTAESAGVRKIYLTGYTPRPVDEFGRVNKALAKVALGAEKMLLWEYLRSTSSLITKLKKAGFLIVALEQSSQALDYRQIKLKAKTALMVGEEVSGLSSKLLNQADKIIELPMRGRKESLNVSVAVGIAIYSLLDL